MAPLEGLKVLDFTQFTSGPVCTYMLADFGADVYKLENPPLGDANHYNTPSKNKHTVFITSLNHGKKSVLMNMKNAEHVALFMEMVKTADLVIDNFKAGTLEKFGITYDTLKEANPAIVWASISGYGQKGPWAKRTAYDVTIQAASGLISVSGDEGGSPVKAGVSMSDFCSGLYCCCGVMAALLDAKRSGKGRRIDLAMVDSSFSLVEQAIAKYYLTGEVAKPMGRQHMNFAPYNSYECKDGQEMLICTRTDEQFAALCGALDCAAVAGDEKFATVKARLANREALNEAVAAAVKNFCYEELAAKLEAADVAYGRINNVNEVKVMEQVQARNMLVTGKYNDGTTNKLVGNPIKLSNFADSDERHCCFKGEDTIDVIAQYVGAERAHEMFDEVMKDSDEKWAERAARLD